MLSKIDLNFNAMILAVNAEDAVKHTQFDEDI